MPTHIEALIADALFRHLSTLSLSPALQIAWQGTSYDPPSDGGAYLRASYIPNTVDTATISRWDRRYGIFQVDVMWPENKGVIPAAEVAGQIADHFPRDTTKLTAGTSTVKIYRTPVIGSALPDPPRMMIPVSVYYECFHENQEQ